MHDRHEQGINMYKLAAKNGVNVAYKKLSDIYRFGSNGHNFNKSLKYIIKYIYCCIESNIYTKKELDMLHYIVMNSFKVNIKNMINIINVNHIFYKYKENTIPYQKIINKYYSIKRNDADIYKSNGSNILEQIEFKLIDICAYYIRCNKDLYKQYIALLPYDIRKLLNQFRTKYETFCIFIDKLKFWI